MTKLWITSAQVQPNKGIRKYRGKPSVFSVLYVKEYCRKQTLYLQGTQKIEKLQKNVEGLLLDTLHMSSYL